MVLDNLINRVNKHFDVDITQKLRKIVFNELSVEDLMKKKVLVKYKFLKIAKNLLLVEVDKLKKEL